MMGNYSFLLLCIHIFSNFLCFNLYKICNLWIVMSLFINSRIVRDLKRSGNYIVSMGNYIVSMGNFIVLMGNYIVSSGSLICHIWHICQNLIFFCQWQIFLSRSAEKYFFHFCIMKDGVFVVISCNCRSWNAYYFLLN